MAKQNESKFNDLREGVLTTIDGEWVGSAFLATAGGFGYKDEIDILYSGADSKFTDTTPGGNLSINPKSQYTRYCDPKRIGIGEGNIEATTGYEGTNLGMGRYYSDAHDDNAQILVMNFGVPDFQSMFSFFSRAISGADSIMVNEGRSPLLYNTAKGLGTVARYIALPAFSIGLLIAGVATKVIAGGTDTRYYTMKPDMISYWSTVNTLVNYLATERGLLRPELQASSADKIGSVVKMNQKDIDQLHKIAPTIIDSTGFIDVFAIANRAAGRITARMKAQLAASNDPSAVFGKVPKPKDYSLTEAAGKIKGNSAYKEIPKDVSQQATPVTPTPPSPTKEEIDSVDGTGRQLRIPSTDNRTAVGETTSWFQNMESYYETMTAAGGSYARFNVEYLGSTTDTFSNSIKDIPTKGMFNGVSNKVRDARFSLSGGNVFGSMVDTIKNGATDVLAGLADGVSAGLSNVVIGLLGGGLLDLPKMWDDSSVSLAQHQYKMTLVSPYGNPISQVLKLDLPMAMVLAAALPRSTGATSYGSPFLCSAYLQGYQDCDLGMITNLSITRGVTNLGFNKSSRPLSLEITFTVTDFSSIVTSPTPKGLTGGLDLSLDDTKPLNKFLNTMAGRDFYTSKYLKPKAMLRAAKLEKDFKSAISYNRMGLLLADSVLGTAGEFIFKNVVLQK